MPVKNILAHNVNERLLSLACNNKTYFGNNPAIPDIYDEPFLCVALNRSFNNSKEELRNIGRIDNVMSDDLSDVLSELITKCKKLEAPYKNELEKICYNAVINLFNIPNDTIKLSLSLSDDMKIPSDTISIDQCGGVDEVEFRDIDDVHDFYGEVYKKKILNAMCFGCAMDSSNYKDLYEEDIADINKELLVLYDQIISLNTYLLFTYDNFNITDKNNKLIGYSTVLFGEDDELVDITSVGCIFPVLLAETIKGLTELFISHGLPNDKKKAEMVVKKSDYVKAEPWCMMVGSYMWNLFLNSLNDITYEDMPYLLKRYASLDVDKFNLLTKEILAQTRRGKHIMSILSKNAKKDVEYNSFLDKMDTMKKGNGIITDEYIHLNEL